MSDDNRILIDANVILRYILQDHREMALRADAMIREGAYTLPEVLAEVIYVLKGQVYQLDRTSIRDALAVLLDEIDIENKTIVAAALDLFTQKNIDFVDAILVARATILHQRIGSFDQRVNKLIRAFGG